MSTIQARDQAPPHDQTGATPPTPIWISHRLQIKLIVGANVAFHPTPLGDDRPIFAGSAEQIEEDIFATHQLGAEELIFNALFSPDIGSIEDLLSHMEQLQAMAQRAERYPATEYEKRAS